MSDSQRFAPENLPKIAKIILINQNFCILYERVTCFSVQGVILLTLSWGIFEIHILCPPFKANSQPVPLLRILIFSQPPTLEPKKHKLTIHISGNIQIRKYTNQEIYKSCPPCRPVLLHRII